MFRKNVTTELIEKYLDRHGWSKHQQVDEATEAQGVVLTGWSAPFSNDGHILVIDPITEKQELMFTVKDIATAPLDATPADRLRDLLLTIAALDSRIIMGKFALDPGDGEVTFRLGIPIASDDLRYEDFERCLQAITATVDRYASELRGIIDGTRTALDVLS